MKCEQHVRSATALIGVTWRKSDFSGPNGGDCIEVGAVARGALMWRKSSYSGPNGGQCVEVGALDLNAVTWRKSSRSGQGGGQCVEVAPGQVVVGVRDSKNPAGPALLFDSAAWSKFVRSL